MEKVGSILTDSPGWNAKSRVPAFPFLLALILGMGVLLGWTAYAGRVELALALLVATGAFLFVLFHPEAGILILISTMLLTYPDVLQGRGLLTINNLLGLMFVVLLLARNFFQRQLWFLQEREVQIFIWIGLAFLLSTLVAELVLPEFPYQELVRLGRRGGVRVRDLTQPFFKDFISRVAFVIFFVNFITTRRQVLYVLFLLLGCILLVVPPALQVYLSGGGEAQRVTAGFAIGGGSGWLSNPNRFAFMCLLGTSLLFFFAAFVQGRMLRLLCISAAVVLTLLVLLPATRRGLWGVGIVGGGFWWGVRVMGRGLSAGVLLLGVSVLVAFFLLLPPLVQERLLNLNPFNPSGEGSHSAEVRINTLAQSFALFTDYPLLGVGLGNFRWMNIYTHGNWKPPHNSYLWALAEGGVVCLGLYLWLFASLFRRLGLLRQSFGQGSGLPYIGEWLTCYLLLFLFFSFFADVWLEEVHLYLIVGLALVLGRLASEFKTHG